MKVDAAFETLLRAQRHIFGTCPHCKSLFRFTDLRLVFGGRYASDWLEAIERRTRGGQAKLEELQEQESTLRQRAVEKARKNELPRLLRRVAPVFSTNAMSPQDVKTIFHPLDYIAFPGMNAGHVKSVVFLDHHSSEATRKSIQDHTREVLDSGAVSWRTIRIDASGHIDAQ